MLNLCSCTVLLTPVCTPSKHDRHRQQLMAVSGQFLTLIGPSGMIERLLLCPLYSVVVFLVSPFTFSIGCPIEGSAGTIVLILPQDLSKPSPLPLHDDGLHSVQVALVAVRCLVRGGYSYRPHYSYNWFYYFNLEGPFFIIQFNPNQTKNTHSPVHIHKKNTHKTNKNKCHILCV